MNWTSAKDGPPNVSKPTDMIVWFANGTWSLWRQQPSDSIPFYPGITHWMILEAPDKQDNQISLWSRVAEWFKS